MYFFKWLFLAELFEKDKAYDLNREDQKQWFLRHIEIIEKEYVELGFLNDLENENEQDIGWTIFKEDVHELNRWFREDNWVKYLSFYENLEPIRRVLEEVTQPSFNSIFQWGIHLMKIRSNEESCFDFVRSIIDNEEGSYDVLVHLFGRHTIKFRTDNLKDLSYDLLGLFKTQPTEFNCEEATDFLKNKYGNNPVLMDSNLIYTFWD